MVTIVLYTFLWTSHLFGPQTHVLDSSNILGPHIFGPSYFWTPYFWAPLYMRSLGNIFELFLYISGLGPTARICFHTQQRPLSRAMCNPVYSRNNSHQHPQINCCLFHPRPHLHPPTHICMSNDAQEMRWISICSTHWWPLLWQNDQNLRQGWQNSRTKNHVRISFNVSWVTAHELRDNWPAALAVEGYAPSFTFLRFPVQIPDQRPTTFKYFVVEFSRASKITKYYLKICHDRFLSHRFKIIFPTL